MDSMQASIPRRKTPEPSERARRFREQMIPPEGFNLADVAYILGIDISSVRRYIRAGELPATNVGREYVVTEKDLRAYIEGQQARRSEKQRAARIRREVMTLYHRVKDTRAAHDLTLATCRACGYESILRLRDVSYDEQFHWVGTCQYCGEEQDLHHWSSQSIADAVASGDTSHTSRVAPHDGSPDPNSDEGLDQIDDVVESDEMDVIPF